MLSDRAVSLIEENVIDTHGFFNSHDMLSDWILSACVEDAMNEGKINWEADKSPRFVTEVYNEIDRIMIDTEYKMDKRG